MAETTTARHVRGSVAAVSRCCAARGCDEFFDERLARKSLRQYRRRGLDATGRRLVDFLETFGVEGRTVLESGGGIGQIQIELLRPGASRATNLELSSAYEPFAAELLRELGFGDRVDRRLVDIATDPEQVERADLVVLHRVVCCYEDFERLLAAAGGRARRALVFSYPPRKPLHRLVVTIENAVLRLLGREFRVFVHSPQAMLDVLELHGLRRTYEHAGVVWQVAGTARAA